MIIALKGPAQCGKSTLAGRLEKELQSRGFNVKRTAFSDFVRGEIVEFLQAAYDNHPIDGGEYPQHVKDIMALMPSWVDTYWDRDCPKDQHCILQDLEKRPAPSHIRAIQQWWGQDFRRAQDPLYWVKKSFLANAEFILESGNNILIEESCRQQNEGHYCHALGGVVLDLKPLPSPTESEGAAMSHAVEQAAMKWTGDFPIFMSDYYDMSNLDKLAWIRKLATDCLAHMSMPMVALPTE